MVKTECLISGGVFFYLSLFNSVSVPVSLSLSPAFWSFMWFVGFCFLANQWQVTQHEDNPLREGGDAARAAITFSFFSIFTWVRGLHTSVYNPDSRKKLGHCTCAWNYEPACERLSLSRMPLSYPTIIPSPVTQVFLSIQKTQLGTTDSLTLNKYTNRV